MLIDGFDFVLDLKRSQGRRLVDARTGASYLDMFGFFASSALGMNHPALAADPEFRAELLTAALNKPANSDIYTLEMARFVETFRDVLGDPRLPHLFFIEGGTLAVENALKVAFDWKSRRNEAKGLDPALGGQVLHLTGAFHGRSGYALSLTNTDPVKTDRFPKFGWPRIHAPIVGPFVEAREQRVLLAAQDAFDERPNDIACFICEPIQGEGGDRHLRGEFLCAMQQLCHDNDALFIVDEVQTGVGLTGTTWAYQQFGLEPDVVAFGKKTQVCGIMAGGRVDEVPDNVFRVSSRINSTWGGNLTDMVRARKILETIADERLIDRVGPLGDRLLRGLEWLAKRHAVVTEPRGRGLMCAFTLRTRALRDQIVSDLFLREHVLVVGTGETGIRFRPPLTVTADEIDEAVEAVDRVLELFDLQS